MFVFGIGKEGYASGLALFYSCKIIDCGFRVAHYGSSYQTGNHFGTEFHILIRLLFILTFSFWLLAFGYWLLAIGSQRSSLIVHR